MIAAVVITMPRGVSMGKTMPKPLVARRGIRQYPKTLELRAQVSVAEK